MDATVTAVAARADNGGVPIDEGWDSRVLVVDETWVVKTPRRPEVTRRLELEVRLLEANAPRPSSAHSSVRSTVRRRLLGPPRQGSRFSGPRRGAPHTEAAATSFAA